jgi:Winged helix-turn helix
MRTAPAPVLEVTAAQRAAVEATLRRRDLTPRLRERLEMVKAAALGQELDAIARWSGRTPETVRHWLAALEAAVETPPRTLGLPFDVWTSSRLSAYLTQQTGVRIAPGWLRVLLHQQRFACGRAKHTLAHRQDPAEVAACQEALRVAGEKGASGPRAV